LQGGKLLDSRWLDLSSGRTEVDLPWRESFVHEVTIGVATADGSEQASGTVLFPGNRELGVKVETGRATYRPGEEAEVGFAAIGPDGRPVEAALGVSVVDAAVGERARTDSLAVWQQREDYAGVTMRDLYLLDCGKPFDADLDLVAELMLSNSWFRPNIEGSEDFLGALESRFQHAFDRQFARVQTALKERYDRDYHHARDEATLKQDLAEAGIHFDALRDPWEQMYRVEFQTNGRFNEALIKSAGPDGQFGTRDDLTAATISREWFLPAHARVSAALQRASPVPMTEAAARSALHAAGVDFEKLLDPWGTPVQLVFGIRLHESTLHFRSAGPDRTFGTGDDIEVDDIRRDYFAESRDKLARQIAGMKDFPRDEVAWRVVLRAAWLPHLRDPWGSPIYAQFQVKSRYTDISRSYTEAEFGGAAQSRTERVPATEHYYAIALYSAGPDRHRGTKDDFRLAEFDRTEKVETRDAASRPIAPARPASPDKGAIAGTVSDPRGLAIPGATIRAAQTGIANGVEHRAQSGSDGRYRLEGLEPGTYDLRFESPGFELYLLTRVEVTRGTTAEADVSLRLGTSTETVTVTAVAGLAFQTSTAMASTSPGMVAGSGEFRVTPRLREYFPETLLWAPLVETGADGHTHLKFPLADNITTWKVEALASTVNGEIGTGSADIRAFQPFFADFDPPRVLTQGDRIQLPATIRNYLEQEQKVTVSLGSQRWFEPARPAEREIRVKPNASANATFPIRTTTAVDDGKARITAQGSAEEAGDAIEKPVTVHPDGNQMSSVQNVVMTDSVSLDVTIPANAIAGSARAEAKIYPNLMAHVVESIEGILRRPYGCAEQTISAAYPNLMLLRYLKSAGIGEHPLRAKAGRNLQAGVDRLAGYRTEDGAYTYWGRGDADVALTAYALAFLHDAKEFVVLDDEQVEDARKWLAKHQDKDGSWPAFTWEKKPDPRRTVYQTAEVALALGKDDAAGKALEYLKAREAAMDEPYLIAAIAMAAQRAGDKALAGRMADRLRRMARHENAMAYWSMETNTPFYGWGLAGRLETTAMAVRALAVNGAAEDRPLIESGALFLLRSQDRYGVWWSTQATVKVLHAILALNGGAESGVESGSAEILVGGKVVATLPIQPAKELAGPLRADLSAFVAHGANRISVRRAGGSQPMQVQLSESHYEPWPEGENSQSEGALKLAVAFDRTAARPGDRINCRVTVERVGFRGYGMMVAEIGLPPGVDIDRHSLVEAQAASAFSVNHYDVLPDRIVLYVWPRADATSFTFHFRPRMGMQAKSAASVLYDYYNPEASVTVPPATFNVEDAAK
jgi:hypothetical protein